jgi:benzylsuccinate CoA-transferase BbsE subunit
MMNQGDPSLLGAYRVLDLTDEKGFLCGKMLADLGADVIKIEKPQGNEARRLGPFYHDIPEPEKSLYWFAYNANKRGITLDIDTRDGREILMKLVKTADVIIESLPVGHELKQSLSYSEIGKINPGIISTSITPFGMTGPYAHYKADDLVGIALSGLMYLTGDSDRAPTFTSVPQAYLHASAQAAAATMISLWYRELSGSGQQVDVSMYESLIYATLNAIPLWDTYHQVISRAGQYRAGFFASAKQRNTWKCQDGYVTFLIIGGQPGAASNQALVDWMDSEGMADFLKNIDWPSLDLAATEQPVITDMERVITRFFMVHTKAELYEGAIKRRIMLYPVHSMADIVEDAQLRHRGFWTEAEYPELGVVVKQPGVFVSASEGISSGLSRAPLPGEHNLEVYTELGLSRSELITLKQANVI